MDSAKGREEKRELEVRGAEEEAKANPGSCGRAAALPTRPPGARARSWVKCGLTWSDCTAALSTTAGGRFRVRPACDLLPCCLRCEGRNKNKTNHGTRSRPAAGGRRNLSHFAPGSGRGDPAAACSLQIANFDKEAANK